MHLGKKGWGSLCTQNGFLPVFGPSHLSFLGWEYSPRGTVGTVGWLALLQLSWLPGGSGRNNSDFHIIFHALCFLCEALARVWVRKNLGRRAVDRIPLVRARWRRGIKLQPCTWLFWGKPCAQVTPGQLLCLQEDKPRATGASMSWCPPGHQQGLVAGIVLLQKEPGSLVDARTCPNVSYVLAPMVGSKRQVAETAEILHLH